MPRVAPLLALLATAALLAAGCDVGDPVDEPAPFAGGADDPGEAQGPPPSAFAFPSVATANTTRVGGADAATDAAAVAASVYPATSAEKRPNAVLLVDERDWQGGLAASVLSGPPIAAPVLASRGGELPEVTSDTLSRLRPRGSDLAKDAQVIRVGSRPPAPEGLRSARISGGDPYAVAAAVDRFASSLRGETSDDVIVASGEQPGFAMPAGAWAARSGDAVLFTRRDTLPKPTADALRAHEKPDIFVLGPESVISENVERELGRLGRVRRIEGPTPVENAVAFARYRASGFGWGIRIPGYQFTVANTSRPLDGAAAAPLGSNGVFAPLLVTDQSARLPRALEGYFLDVRPGFERDPRTAVYNHVWILGDGRALEAGPAGRLDEVAKLIPVQQGDER